jgi:hypothetical protein
MTGVVTAALWGVGFLPDPPVLPPLPLQLVNYMKARPDKRTA